MKIRITVEAPWTIDDRLQTFKVGQEIEIGKDVPDDIGQAMLIHEYAEPAVTKETLVRETKTAEPSEDKDEASKPRGRRKPAAAKE